jgi:hypothetical protein
LFVGRFKAHRNSRRSCATCLAEPAGPLGIDHVQPYVGASTVWTGAHVIKSPHSGGRQSPRRWNCDEGRGRQTLQVLRERLEERGLRPAFWCGRQESNLAAIRPLDRNAGHLASAAKWKRPAEASLWVQSDKSTPTTFRGLYSKLGHSVKYRLSAGPRCIHENNNLRVPPVQALVVGGVLERVALGPECLYAPWAVVHHQRSP